MDNGLEWRDATSGLHLLLQVSLFSSFETHQLWPNLKKEKEREDFFSRTQIRGRHLILQLPVSTITLVLQTIVW